MIAIILAGGGGTRLWPVSRNSSPKQTEAIIGPFSLLVSTFARMRVGFAAADIFVATSAEHADTVRRQLPELPTGNLITEPCRRDTASAIGYALLRISATRPDETFVIINSDAHVRDSAAYHAAIAAAGRAVDANGGRTALIGLRPTHPEIGYGYILTGERLADESGYAVHAVGRFVEKPNLETAREYLADGRYLWNPTLIVGKVRGFLSLYDRHLPQHAELFARMRDSFGTDGEAATVESCFARLPAVSVDYGILEKERDLLVVPAEFGWMDIGNWRTVREVLAREAGENVVRGRHVEIDSSGNLIHCAPGKLVATVGLNDMIIVDTGDALLICPQDRAHEVKAIVGMLKEDESLKGYL